jgi:Family of unknown function (DUF6155)
MNPELKKTLEGMEQNSTEYYKSVIHSAFYNKRGGPRLRLAVARNAIKSFEKASDNKKEIIDLMLFFIETGIEFTNKYGDINESFYSNIEIMYNNAVNHLNAWNDPAMKKIFKPRLKSFVEKTDGIGWGFHDNLSWMYKELKK